MNQYIAAENYLVTFMHLQRLDEKGKDVLPDKVIKRFIQQFEEKHLVELTCEQHGNTDTDGNIDNIGEIGEER